jgi:hypothetical protein
MAPVGCPRDEVTAMELSVNDKTIAAPSADDIRQALSAAPPPGDWYLVLESDDDSYVEASALHEGTYEVTACDRGNDLKASAPITADRLKEILLRFHAGDAAWRDMGFAPVRQSFAKDQRAVIVARARTEPPTWAVAIVVGSIAVVVLTFMVLGGSNNSLREYLPFGDSDYFFIGLIFAPMAVMLAVAVLVKVLEVRRASTWSTAMGRIVRSETEARHHRFAGEATTVKTEPLVEFEFSVGGRTWRGNRISIGEDSGGANTEATLKRYPIGAVVNVHYDPNNPKNCVLERDVPAGMGKGCLVLVGFGAAVALGLYYLVTVGPGLVASHLPNADNTPFVMAATVFGLLVLLFFVGSYRISRRAAGWPSVQGTVLSSTTERVEKRQDGRTSILYAPVVEYGYRVHEVDYVSRQIKLGVGVSGSQAYAEKIAARYPLGRQVDVHYEPANPSNAALENPTGMHWLLLVVALACFAIAAHAGGLI